MKKFISMLLVALSLTVVPVHAATVTADKCIGHRGAMDLAPEGTLAAFQQAKEAGYKRFECDVWYTNSKEFIISHDKNIKKATGKDKNAWTLSSKNRKNYPIIHGTNVKKYPTQYLPTMQEVLNFAEKK